MVLEAREKAEEVGYSLVWQETKEASNVVDYNINKEQTKDISYEINANNQTTTGMATVIPWINAPKLIYNTSILGGAYVNYDNLTLTATHWFPKNDINYFDIVTINEWSDVSLNSSYPNRIYLASWVYIMSGYIHRSWNYSNTYIVIEDEWTIIYAYTMPAADNLLNFIIIVKSDGWYIRIWLNPTANITNTTCTLSLIKLW